MKHLLTSLLGRLALAIGVLYGLAFLSLVDPALTLGLAVVLVIRLGIPPATTGPAAAIRLLAVVGSLVLLCDLGNASGLGSLPALAPFALAVAVLAATRREAPEPAGAFAYSA